MGLRDLRARSFEFKGFRNPRDKGFWCLGLGFRVYLKAHET